MSYTEKAINLSGTCAEATGNDSAELPDECLQLFGHGVALDIYYTFLDYTSCGNESDRVESSTAQLAHLDAFIATVMTFLTKPEKRGGSRQKIYADTYSSYVNTAIKQLVRRVSSFLKTWNPDEHDYRKKDAWSESFLVLSVSRCSLWFMRSRLQRIARIGWFVYMTAILWR